ncbi:MAG TPA: EamA family transporter [Gaiellaceae bacterium]|jgi:drug/metabolite transporter (DMT)-like permease|nr:EamA family transporter [Gaiellaceae bacterium]
MRRSTGIILVAVAAALWGLDAWIRKPLAQSTDVATIVFGEHLVLVLCTLPFLAGALAAVFRLGWRYVLAAVVIGAGSSALATILFTQAFVDGDPVTPVVLQKVQPIIAVVAARIILGEQPRPRFALYFVPALAGVWLIGVQHPFHPTAQGLKPMLFALGAAALWALGTVLGRYLSQRMKFQHVTTLRFAFGLPAAAIALLVLGAPAFASGHDTVWIAVLALVTGLVALGLYYYGLQSTPAVAATIAELAFPVSATLVGYFKFGYVLTGWQWVGVGLTTLVVALLPASPIDRIERVPAPAPAPA